MFRFLYFLSPSFYFNFITSILFQCFSSYSQYFHLYLYFPLFLLHSYISLKCRLMFFFSYYFIWYISCIYFSYVGWNFVFSFLFFEIIILNIYIYAVFIYSNQTFFYLTGFIFYLRNTFKDQKKAFFTLDFILAPVIIYF